MNSTSQISATEIAADDVFVLPLIPLLDCPSASSGDDEECAVESTAFSDFDYSGSYVEAMD